MNIHETLSIEQRIAACKKNGADWLVFDPDKKPEGPSEAQLSAERVRKMRRLRDRWSTGLITNYPTPLCVQPDGTVAFLYKEVSAEHRNHHCVQFLLAQKNVRKIFSNGRTAVALHRDGTVSVHVGYDKNDEKDTIRMAKDMAASLKPANDWRDVVDIASYGDILCGLRTDGTLYCCIQKDKYTTPVKDWARQVRNAQSLGSGAFTPYCRLADGSFTCKEMEIDSKPACWINLINTKANLLESVACSYDFGAGIYKDGGFTYWNKKGDDTFRGADKWKKLATIHADFQTMVGVTPSGEVQAVGKDADQYKGWMNVALLTGDCYHLHFAICWDGSCISCENKEVAVDFSWIFEE